MPMSSNPATVRPNSLSPLKPEVASAAGANQNSRWQTRDEEDRSFTLRSESLADLLLTDPRYESWHCFFDSDQISRRIYQLKLRNEFSDGKQVSVREFGSSRQSDCYCSLAKVLLSATTPSLHARCCLDWALPPSPFHWAACWPGFAWDAA